MSTFTNRQRNLAIGGSALVGLAIAATLGAGYIATSGTIPGAWFITGEQAYSTTGTSSDIALTSTTSVFAYTGSSTATFTGFAGGVAGRTVIGENRTAFNVTLSYEVTSTAANRLSTPTSVDWTCLPGGSWTQMYVAGSTNRWSVFPGSACFSSTHPATSVACAAGERDEWDGTQWQCRTLNDYRSKHLEWSEEYLAASSAVAAPVGGLGFFCAGTACGYTNNQGTTTRPGIAVIGTGTTTTGESSMLSSSSAFDFGSYSSATFEWTGGFSTLSTGVDEYSAVIGFSDVTSVTNNATDGCYFVYDRGNVLTNGCNTGNANTWEVVCASNSVRTVVLLDGSSQNGSCAAGSITTVSSSVAALTLPDTNIVSLKVVVTGTSSAAFFIGGSLVATLTTNIPSGSSRLTGVGFTILKTLGTTSRTITTDRHRIAIDLLAARNL